MNNLTRVLKIWDNLEETFSKSDCKTRVDFLHRVTGYDGEQGTAISYIINKLKDDSDKYDEHELELFSETVAMLESIHELVINKKFESVDNFDDVLSLAKSGKIARKLERNLLTQDMLDELNFSKGKLNIDKTFEGSFEKIFSQLKTLGDTTIEVGSDVISMQLCDDNAYIFYNMSDVERVIKEASNNKFYESIAFITKDLMSRDIINDSNIFNQIFLNRKYFNINKGKIEVKIGDYEYSTKVRSDNKIVVDDIVAYTSSLPTEYGRFKVILIDC